MMGLFGKLFGGKNEIVLDRARSDQNKATLRTLFDQKVANPEQYQIVYGYSEDIGGMNFGILRTVSYKYRNFIIGFNTSERSLVFLEITPDLSQTGEQFHFTSQNIKKAKTVKMLDGYYLQYGNAMKKEYFNFKVVGAIDDVLNEDGYEDNFFVYVDQTEEKKQWQQFWNQFCQ